MGKSSREFFRDNELFSGPPPSIGWWPATIHKFRSPIRWWNGENWSACAFKGDSIQQVTLMANTKADPATQKEIKWAKPWW
jgi:hypothetical protein